MAVLVGARSQGEPAVRTLSLLLPPVCNHFTKLYNSFFLFIYF